MYPTSDSPHLTSEQLSLLDDTLFESNPASYWRARIDDLLREPGPINYGAGLAAQVAELGLDERVLYTTQPTKDERELQKALDAFALRHHLAESLVRMVHSVLTESETSQAGIWTALASGPSQGHDVVKALRAFEARGEVPARLFLPATYLSTLPEEPPSEIVAAIQMHWRWVQRAMQLLVTDGLDTNVGNNKLKHGLAVRPHNQLRVSFMTEPPQPDGSVPLSAIRTGSSVIDALAIEFLQRLPSRHEHSGTWEVTVLNLRPAQLIAETLMLSTVWSSVFATAAAHHIAGQDKVAPQHPGLVLGPSPEAIVREIIGYRQALTISTKSGTSRGLVVETPREIISLTQTGPKVDAIIVDDRPR